MSKPATDSGEPRGARPRRWRRWFYATAVIVVVLGAGLAGGWYLRTTTYYTDGDSIDEPRRLAAVRKILWQPPRTVDELSDFAGEVYEPSLSWDGLTLLFVRGRAGGDADIHASTRTPDGWTAPEPIDAINSPYDELGPRLSFDGSRLYFYSDRPGGLGGYDLWVAQRGPEGWETPANLGNAVNSSYHEYGPAPGPDGSVLYFASNRPTVDAPQDDRTPQWPATLREDWERRTYDLYRSSISDAGYAIAVPLAVLNTPANEGSPCVSPVGDFLYFASDRPGGAGGFDLLRSRRSEGGWSVPENLGATVNSAHNELDPGLAALGYELLFSSDRLLLAPTGGDAPERVYQLYATSSREVYLRSETAAIDLAGLMRALLPSLLWLLLALLLLLLLALLAKASRSQRLSLLIRCLIASLMAHLALMILLSFWQVTSGIIDAVQRPGRLQIAIGTSAEEQAIVSQLTGVVSDAVSIEPEMTALPALEAPRPDMAADRPTITATIEAPAVEPARPLPTHAPALDVVEAPPTMRPSPSSRVVPSAELAVSVPEPRAARAEPVTEAVRDRARPSPVAQTEAPPLATGSVPPTPVAETVPLADAPVQHLHADRRLALNDLRHVAQPSPRPVPTTQPVVPAAQPIVAALPASSTPRRADESEPQVVAAAPAALPPISPPSGARPSESKTVPLPAETTVPLPRAQTVRRTPPPVARETPVVATVPKLASPITTVKRPEDVPLKLPSLELPRVELAASSPSPSTAPPVTERIVDRPTAARIPTMPLPDAPVAARVSTVPPAADERPAPARPTVAATAPAPRTTLPRAVETQRAPLLSAPRSVVPAAPIEVSVALPKATEVPATPYPQRAPDLREHVLQQRGGSDETEEAVRRALSWLARYQSADGHWGGDEFDETCRCGGASEYDVDAALTGLSLLCFLGAGHTHLQSGPYQVTVQRALYWLLEQQKPNGDLRFGETMYSHGIATIALCEALGMTQDERLRPAAERAVAFLVAARSRRGGWRYEPGQAGDTSVTGWQVMALRSAEAAGLNPPKVAYDNARKWMGRVDSRRTPGIYRYQPGKRPSPSMTAEGMFIQQLLGVGRDETRMRVSAAYVGQHPPKWSRRKVNTYYWYYATLALFHRQGQDWETWNETLRTSLLSAQRQEGTAAGSWDPDGEWAPVGGRVYQTAICTLMLEVYYRYLPMYSRTAAKADPRPGAETGG